MKRIKISPNFYLDEYIPKDLYLKYIDTKPHYLTWLIDNRLIEADQKLRDIFGPITINNWISGGSRNWSALRTPDSPYYKSKSQHSFGRASDKIFKNATADEVREYIKEHWKDLQITAIENNVSWVHSDFRYIPNQKELMIFNS